MKDSKYFWKEIRSINDANSTLLASTINDVSCHDNITNTWQDYYKGLLNTCTCKDIGIGNLFTPIDI